MVAAWDKNVICYSEPSPSTIILRSAGINAQASTYKVPRKMVSSIFGASHQIMHVMVIVARLVHTFGVL
jgi:predicted membrane channel-forming protein YqfA (hemolysin III family)